jgi:tetratricopeptide (TPR) repeat protein
MAFARLRQRLACQRLIREGKEAYLELDLTSAESRLREAYRLAIAVRSDSMICAAAENFYLVLRRRRLYDEAVPVLENLIESHQRTCRRDCDDSFAWRNELIAVLARVQKYSDAEAVAMKRVAAARRRYGFVSIQSGFAGCTAGWAVREQGRLEEAEQLYRGALAVLEEAAGPNASALGWAQCGLAATLLSSGDTSAAGELINAAHGNWWRIGNTDLADAALGMQIDQLIACERLPDALDLSNQRLNTRRNFSEAAARDTSRQLGEIVRHSFLLAATGKSDLARRYERRAEVLRLMIADEPPAAIAIADPSGPIFDSEPLIDWVGVEVPIARSC